MPSSNGASLDPRLYFVSFGGDERRAQDRMSQIIKAALNEEITKRTVREVISGERGKVMDAIRNKVSEEAQARSACEIIDVRLKRVDYVEQINALGLRADEGRAGAGGQRTALDRRRPNRKRSAPTPTASAPSSWRKPTATPRSINGDGDAKASQIYAEAFGQEPRVLQVLPQPRSLSQQLPNRSDCWCSIRIRSSSSISAVPTVLPPKSNTGMNC